MLAKYTERVLGIDNNYGVWTAKQNSLNKILSTKLSRVCVTLRTLPCTQKSIKFARLRTRPSVPRIAASYFWSLRPFKTRVRSLSVACVGVGAGAISGPLLPGWGFFWRLTIPWSESGAAYSVEAYRKSFVGSISLLSLINQNSYAAADPSSGAGY